MHALFCLLSLLQYLAAAGDVTLVFAGDAMQHDRQIAAARSGGVYDYSACFANVADYVKVPIMLSLIWNARLAVSPTPAIRVSARPTVLPWR